MKEYELHNPKSKPDNNRIQSEIVGDALKLCRPRRRREDGEPPFRGQRNCGRQKARGWTRTTRATLLEKLERNRHYIRSCIHLVLPFDVSAQRAESIFNHLQRWLKSRGIGAIGVCETPKPHFHIAVCVQHTIELEAALRKAVTRWWNQVLWMDPTEKTLQWEPRPEPTEAIVKYLTQMRKGGRGVKGKARWLTFRPYFTTGLPKQPRRFVYLDEKEQSEVLVTRHSIVFGAAAELQKCRQQAAQGGGPLLQRSQAAHFSFPSSKAGAAH